MKQHRNQGQFTQRDLNHRQTMLCQHRVDHLKDIPQVSVHLFVVLVKGRLFDLRAFQVKRCKSRRQQIKLFRELKIFHLQHGFSFSYWSQLHNATATGSDSITIFQRHRIVNGNLFRFFFRGFYPFEGQAPKAFARVDFLSALSASMGRDKLSRPIRSRDPSIAILAT
jgi:hypothetical protein